jgi:DNA-binding transcriptional LysR family regulator
MHCDSAQAVRAAVRETMGVGFLYDDIVKASGHEDFKTLRLAGVRLNAKIFIAYRKDKPLAPPAHDFLLLLRQWRDQNMNVEKHSAGFIN